MNIKGSVQTVLRNVVGLGLLVLAVTCIWALCMFGLFMYVATAGESRPIELYEGAAIPFALDAQTLDEQMLSDSLARVAAAVHEQEPDAHLRGVTLTGSCRALPRISGEVSSVWSTPAWRSIGGIDTSIEAYASIHVSRQELDLEVIRMTYVYNQPELRPLPSAPEFSTVLDAAANSFASKDCTIKLWRHSRTNPAGNESPFWSVCLGEVALDSECSHRIDSVTGILSEYQPQDSSGTE